MNREELDTFLKAFSFVQRLVLWSRAERFRGSGEATDDELVKQINFAIVCIEYIYQEVPGLTLADEAVIELTLLVEKRKLEDFWQPCLAQQITDAAKRGKDFRSSLQPGE